jgi:hypothetical protein
MMLRNLVNEVVSRRMWPIPLVAIVVAVAAPLLFMKSGGEPVSTAPPPIAQPGKLPTGAEKLVSNQDKTAATPSKAKRKSQDPFAPPKSAKPKGEPPAPAAGATAATAATSTASSGVVINNSDGSTATMQVPASTQRASAPKSSTTKTSSTKKSTTKTTTKKTTPKATTPKATVPEVTTTYVDARFGARQNTYVRYRVPRLQTFRAGGRIAAIFVGYSSKRNVAVFAVAPSTQVKGDVECRTIKGVCRYVDLPEGKYARLVLRGVDGELVSRRLDVVDIRTLAGKEDTFPRENPLETATCLLKGLLRLTPNAPSIASDACA